MLHVREDLGGRLNTRTNGRAHMQQNLAGVDIGEKIASEKRYQREREHDESEEPRHKDTTMGQQQLKYPAVARTDALETALKSALEPHERVGRNALPWFSFLHVGLEQVHGHRGHEGPRQDERRDHQI